MRFIDNPIRRRVQPPEVVVSWMDVGEGMRVLEVGPGSGTFTLEAARRVGGGGAVFAVDIQASVLSMLNARLKREGVSSVEPVPASAYSLPFRSGAFDRVYMIAVLAEIPDKVRALLKVKRVLRDDGLLAIGEILFDPDYPRRTTVIRWCREAGFELVRSHGEFYTTSSCSRTQTAAPTRLDARSGGGTPVALWSVVCKTAASEDPALGRVENCIKYGWLDLANC